MGCFWSCDHPDRKDCSTVWSIDERVSPDFSRAFCSVASRRLVWLASSCVAVLLRGAVKTELWMHWRRKWRGAGGGAATHTQHRNGMTKNEAEGRNESFFLIYCWLLVILLHWTLRHSFQIKTSGDVSFLKGFGVCERVVLIHRMCFLYLV